MGNAGCMKLKNSSKGEKPYFQRSPQHRASRDLKSLKLFEKEPEQMIINSKKSSIRKIILSNRSTAHNSHLEQIAHSDYFQNKAIEENELYQECTIEFNQAARQKVDRLVIKQNVQKFYELQQLLGQGSYGVVHLASNKKNLKITRAIKQINKKYEKQFLNEFYTLSQLNHPNIIQVYEIFEDQDNYNLSLEYCEGGDLSSYIRNLKKPIEEKLAAKIIFQLLKAVSHLHKNGFLHRDIKAENILISYNHYEQITVKLCDFGFCSTITLKDNGEQVKFKDICGTPYYVAPEVLNQSYNEKCDLWSIGVLLYYMLCQSFPFFATDNGGVMEKIKQGQASFEEPQWEKVSKEGIDIVKRLLTRNPIIRINDDEALNHKWFEIMEAKDFKRFDLSTKEKIRNNIVYGNPFKMIVLMNIIQQKPQNQIWNINQFFYQKDRDNSGVILHEDFIKAISNDNQKDEILIRQNMSKLDFRNDKKIPYNLFAALCLDFENDVSKKILWDTYKFLQDQESQKITKNSLQQQIEMKLNNNPFDENTQNIIQQILSDIAQSSCTNNNSNKQEINFCQYMSYMNRLNQ